MKRPKSGRDDHLVGKPDEGLTPKLDLFSDEQAGQVFVRNDDGRPVLLLSVGMDYAGIEFGFDAMKALGERICTCLNTLRGCHTDVLPKYEGCFAVVRCLDCNSPLKIETSAQQEGLEVIHCQCGSSYALKLQRRSKLSEAQAGS